MKIIEFVVEVSCIHCKKKFTMTLPAEGYRAWTEGNKIQDTMPKLTLDERELLISKTCGECYDAMFKELEDEAYQASMETNQNLEQS
jgi:hypothetical protein